MLPTSWKSFHVVFSFTLRGHFGTKRLVKLKDQTLSSFHFWIFGTVRSQTCYFCHTSARPVDQNIWALLVIKLPMIGSTSRVWPPLVIDLRLQSALGLVSVRCHQTHHTTTDRCRQRHVKLSNPYPLINRESVRVSVNISQQGPSVQ